MNGWQRLGVVISAIIAIPAFLVTHDEVRTYSRAYPVSPLVSSLPLDQYNGAVWGEWLAVDQEARLCDPATARVFRSSYGMADITCKKRHIHVIEQSVWALLIPFIIVFGVGYTIAWVRRGFREVQPKRS